MKTEKSITQEQQANSFRNGALTMDRLLSNPDIIRTIIIVSPGGDNDVQLTLSGKGANTIQIVAYSQPDKNGITHADGWAEWNCSNPATPVARMHLESRYDAQGRSLNKHAFGDWVPTSAENALERVAQAAVEKRAALEVQKTSTNRKSAQHAR